MLSINSYWRLTANKNGLNSHTFSSLSRIVLAKAAKVAKKLSEVKIAVLEGVPSRIVRLKLLSQFAAARVANTRLGRPVY